MPADFPKAEHPVLKLTQDAYDALVSLQKRTLYGTWRKKRISTRY